MLKMVKIREYGKWIGFVCAGILILEIVVGSHKEAKIMTYQPEAASGIAVSSSVNESSNSFDNPQTLSSGRTSPSALPVMQKEDEPAVWYLGSAASYILNLSDNMTVAFAAQNLLEAIPVIIETYRLPNIARLLEQGHIFRDYEVPLSLLERTDTNVFLLENGDNYFSIAHQGDGAYIVAVTYTDPYTGEESHHRASYMITPLSVYMQASSRDTLVWINSSLTGGGVKGLKIYFGDEDEPVATTDKSGMAFFCRDSKVDENYFRIYDKMGELVYYDDGVSQYGYGLRERYYSYLFLDRTIYRPEDTINFWGTVQPFRNNEHDMPDTVRITFDANGLNLEQDVPLSPGGFFNGTIELDRIRSAQYSIQASLHFPSDDEDSEDETHIVFENRHVSVRDFQKPAYTIESEVGRIYYFPGDDVTVSAKIAFYDGTPLRGCMAEVSYFDSGKRQWVELNDVETDTDGYLTFSFPAWATSGHVSGSLTVNSYRIRIASDGEDITHTERYYVFPSDVLIDAQIRRQEDGENISLIIETFRLDAKSEALKAEVEKYGSWLNNDRLLQIAKGEAVDIDKLRISLSWNYFDQNDENRRHSYGRWFYYYDEDKKSMQSHRMLFDPDYNYNYITERNPDVPIRLVTDQSTREKMLEVDTKDGSIIIEGILFLDEAGINWDKQAFAQAVISFSDTIKNTRVGWGYYPNYWDYREDWSSAEHEQDIIEGYSLAINNLTSRADSTARAGYYNRLGVDIDDSLQFNLMYDSEPAQRGGKILYSLIQDGVIEYRVVSSDRFNFQYTMEYGPNLSLAVVYFDGHSILPVCQSRIIASSDSLMLNVDVKTDKENYAPGDTVNLAIRTTDNKGKGIPANVCVAVVDEAAFAVSEQYISLLYEFYGDIRYTNNEIRQYFTYMQGDDPELYRDGDGKDGNSKMVFYDNFRSNFKDTAAFLPASTNRSGYANLSFKLPDNNTSWRITSLAVGDNLMAGHTKDNLISTMPFFVRPVMNPKYIEGDDIAMLIQGHGIVLNADSDVSFVVNITGDNINETVDFSGKAYMSHELNFGKLKSGSYTLTFQARYGTYIDTIVLPMSIIRSNLELVISKKVDLSQKLVIEASRYPVTLTFYDSSTQPFITSLNSLLGHYCMQTSQRMSRVVAKQSLRESMPSIKVPSYVADTSEDIADMQNVDGGIGYYIGDYSDPRLTTYVLLASSGDPFDLGIMAEYFKGVLGKSSGDSMTAALCRLGLAFIGDDEMTTETLETELAKEADLAVKAHYIAAIAALGDLETALVLYDQHLASHVPDSNNEKITAGIWIAATLLQHDDADEIALLFGERPWRINTLYECMIYVRHFSKIIEPQVISYTTCDKEHTLEFGFKNGRNQSGFMQTLVLSQSELESLEITDIPDSIRATVYYIGEPSEIGLKPSDNMAIDKSIKPVDDKTYEITLSIALDSNAPLGQYDISEWIPSNTRLYDFDTRYQTSKGNTYFNTRQELQNLYISFNRDRKEKQTITYTYCVRQVFESEAIMDTAYMIHGNTGENANSAKSVFRLKN